MTETRFEKNFGGNLQLLLTRTSMSQRELARRLNVSNATVSRWIKGNSTDIHVCMLFRLCDIFQVDPMYFVERW